MSIDVVTEKKTKSTSRFREPKKYKVIFCNDDVTPVEFVIAVLMSVFKHNQESAFTLTMKIHNSGSAVAGLFSHEVAEQKSIDTINLARANGYPLITKIEPE